MRDMQRIDPRRFGSDPLLAERINRRWSPGLEQIELQLRRKLEDTAGRQRAQRRPETAPPGTRIPSPILSKLSKDK